MRAPRSYVDRAVMANKGPMARWGLIVAALLVLGSIPAFVGLAVVLPVLGYATGISMPIWSCAKARAAARTR